MFLFNKKPSITFIIVITTLLFSAQPSTITPDWIIFDDNKISISSNDTHSTLQLFCEAFIGNCSFKYNYLPSGWEANENNLIFSNQQLNKVRIYAAQVNISQLTGNWILKNLTFQNQFGAINLTSNTVSSSFPLNKNQSINNKSTTQQSQSSSQYDNRYDQLIKDRLPTSQNIIYALKKKQSGTLVIEIQRLISYPSNLPNKSQPCPQDYYDLLKSDVFPALKQHTSLYQKQYSLQKANIQKLQTQIKNLQITEQKLKLQRTEDLQDQINRLQIQYEKQERNRNNAYSIYYSSNIIAGKYKEKINEILPITIDDESQAKAEQLKLSIIKDQKRLKQISDEKRALEIQESMISKRVSIDKKKVQALEKYPNQIIDKERLRSLQNSFRYYSSRAIQNKQLYEKAEKRSQQIGKQIDSLKQDIAEYTQKTKTVKQQISQKESLLREILTSQNSFKTFRENLVVSLKKINEEIIKCQTLRGNTDPKILQQDTNNSSVSSNHQKNDLTVNNKGNDFLDKFRENYETAAKKLVNLYSLSWIRSYGVPKPVTFACQILSNVSGYGRILAITQKGFRILLPEGNTEMILFSLCSKIYTFEDSQAPKLGNILEWNGTVSKKGQFHLYNAIIYPEF